MIIKIKEKTLNIRLTHKQNTKQYSQPKAIVLNVLGIQSKKVAPVIVGMKKTTYDTDEDGVVDNSKSCEDLGGVGMFNPLMIFNSIYQG